MSEYGNATYWNEIYDLDLHSNATTQGNDGEDEFDEKILSYSKKNRFLDVGCGDGSFTLKVAESAKEVVGIDFSRRAIEHAMANLANSNRNNVRFENSNVDNLRFNQETFDLVYSRRGPLTHGSKSLFEARRVLKNDGILMEITIGEHDKENIARIFGRGQMLGSEKVSILKDRMLRQSGLKPIEIKDYIATEVFPTLNDLIVRLTDSPIIPDFDRVKDAAHLDKVEKECMTKKGIETPSHRVIIVARK